MAIATKGKSYESKGYKKSIPIKKKLMPLEITIPTFKNSVEEIKWYQETLARLDKELTAMKNKQMYEKDRLSYKRKVLLYKKLQNVCAALQAKHTNIRDLPSVLKLYDYATGLIPEPILDAQSLKKWKAAIPKRIDRWVNQYQHVLDKRHVDILLAYKEKITKELK